MPDRSGIFCSVNNVIRPVAAVVVLRLCRTICPFSWPRSPFSRCTLVGRQRLRWGPSRGKNKPKSRVIYSSSTDKTSTQYVCSMSLSASQSAYWSDCTNPVNPSANPLDLGRSAQLAMIAAYLDRLVQVSDRGSNGLSRSTAVLLRGTTRVAWSRLRGRSVRPHRLLHLWKAVSDRLALIRSQSVSQTSDQILESNSLDLIALDTAMLLLSDLQTPDRPRLFCPTMQAALAHALLRSAPVQAAERSWQQRLISALAYHPDRMIASACRGL